MTNSNNHIDIKKIEDHYGRERTTTVVAADKLPQTCTAENTEEMRVMKTRMLSQLLYRCHPVRH